MKTLFAYWMPPIEPRNILCLFLFLAVKTNAGFSVTAESLVQNETKDLRSPNYQKMGK